MFIFSHVIIWMLLTTLKAMPRCRLLLIGTHPSWSAKEGSLLELKVGMLFTKFFTLARSCAWLPPTAALKIDATVKHCARFRMPAPWMSVTNIALL